MALDNYYRNKIEGMKLEIIQGQAVLRRLEAQRNDYNSRVRLLREELGLLQQPGSYVGEVVKVMSTKKVLVKVHPEGKYGMSSDSTLPILIVRLIQGSVQSSILQTAWTSRNLPWASGWLSCLILTNWRRCCPLRSIRWYR